MGWQRHGVLRTDDLNDGARARASSSPRASQRPAHSQPKATASSAVTRWTSDCGGLPARSRSLQQPQTRMLFPILKEVARAIPGADVLTIPGAMVPFPDQMPEIFAQAGAQFWNINRLGASVHCVSPIWQARSESCPRGGRNASAVRRLRIGMPEQRQGLTTLCCSGQHAFPMV